MVTIEDLGRKAPIDWARAKPTGRSRPLVPTKVCQEPAVLGYVLAGVINLTRPV